MATVKFKVTSFVDPRATNSSLEIGNVYEGDYHVSNNSVQWTDPQNDQEWTFWVGDTCELVGSLEDIVKDVYQKVRETMKNVSVVTTEIDHQYCLSQK